MQVSLQHCWESSQHDSPQTVPADTQVLSSLHISQPVQVSGHSTVSPQLLVAEPHATFAHVVSIDSAMQVGQPPSGAGMMSVDPLHCLA
jgi:hypothetical protein